eukprot:8036-Amphidinium_carterae.1
MSGLYECVPYSEEADEPYVIFDKNNKVKFQHFLTWEEDFEDVAFYIRFSSLDPSSCITVEQSAPIPLN